MQISEERVKKTDYMICIMLSFYIFLSFFEVYIQQFLGPINRLFMLLLAGVLLVICGFNLKLNSYTIFVVLWFAFKCLSIIWSNHSNSQEVSRHLASQIGIVIMTAVLSGIVFNKSVLNWCIKSLLLFSFLYGILSVFFSQPFRGVFTGRQVLTLFGAQNDPNNNAAFLIIAVSMAFYSIVFDHKHLMVNAFIILVNTYAIFLTGSRTGFLSIAVVAIIIIFTIPFRKTTGQKDYTLLSICFIVLLGFALIYLSKDYLPSNIRDRLLAFNEYEEGSGRASRWENAMRLFSENPILGKGWGGYLLERVEGDGIHNTFITNLCDVGIIGTILLVTPIFNIILQAIKKRDGLALIVLANGLFFSLTLDAINKRFFWNAIYIAIMILNYDEVYSEPINVWYKIKEKHQRKESNYKYIR